MRTVKKKRDGYPQYSENFRHLNLLGERVKEDHMQLLLLVTKKEELIDELMKQLAIAGVKGGTVLDSTGMAKSLANVDGMPMFDVFKEIVKQQKTTSKTVLFGVEDEKVDVVRKTVSDVFGNLNKPNTGVLMGIPLSFVDGINKE